MTDHGWEDPDAEEAFVDDRPSSTGLLDGQWWSRTPPRSMHRVFFFVFFCCVLRVSIQLGCGAGGLLLAVPEIDLDALSEDFTESEVSRLLVG